MLAPNTMQTRAQRWANLPPERKQEIIRRHACHLLAHIEAKRWLADHPTRERPLHPVERFGTLAAIPAPYFEATFE